MLLYEVRYSRCLYTQGTVKVRPFGYGKVPVGKELVLTLVVRVRYEVRLPSWYSETSDASRYTVLSRRHSSLSCLSA